MRSTVQRLASSCVWTSPYSIDIPRVTLPKFLQLDRPSAGHTAKSERPAVIDVASGRKLTYAELPNAVARAVKALRDRGVKPRNVVNIHAVNSIDFIVAFQAVLALGAVCTTSNPAYKPHELTAQYVDARAQYAITTNDLYDTVKAGASADTGIKAVWRLDDLAGSLDTISIASGHSERHIEFEEVDSEDTAVIPYSSGTTGLPKGVELSHRNLIANALQTVHPESNLGLRPDDTMLAILPLYHIYGMQVQMTCVLHLGATAVVLPRFEPVSFMESLSKHRVTIAPLVPPVVSFLLRHPLASSPQYDISSLRSVFSGAAPLDGASQRALADKLSIDVRQGYGMSEMSPISHVDPIDRHGRPHTVYGSVGVPVASTSAQVVDVDSGEAIPPGSLDEHGQLRQGELWVKGPQVMKGYLHNPTATAQTLTPDGYCRTGDIVAMREDGYTFVTDRLKELIKVKGLQVAPAELEGIILKHQGVMDAAVVGVPDPKAGERPVAFVVRKRDVAAPAGTIAHHPVHRPPAPQVTDADLQAFLAAEVAEYKQLAAIYFVENIPRNPSGKILRRKLKELLPA